MSAERSKTAGKPVQAQKPFRALPPDPNMPLGGLRSVVASTLSGEG